MLRTINILLYVILGNFMTKGIIKVFCLNYSFYLDIFLWIISVFLIIICEQIAIYRNLQEK